MAGMDGVVVVLLCVGIVWGAVGLTTTILIILGVLPTIKEVEQRQAAQAADRDASSSR
jgi:hypothetical protein